MGEQRLAIIVHSIHAPACFAFPPSLRITRQMVYPLVQSSFRQAQPVTISFRGSTTGRVLFSVLCSNLFHMTITWLRPNVDDTHAESIAHQQGVRELRTHANGQRCRSSGMVIPIQVEELSPAEHHLRSTIRSCGPVHLTGHPTS
jgi:hypothetical protein